MKLSKTYTLLLPILISGCSVGININYSQGNSISIGEVKDPIAKSNQLHISSPTSEVLPAVTVSRNNQNEPILDNEEAKLSLSSAEYDEENNILNLSFLAENKTDKDLLLYPQTALFDDQYAVALHAYLKSIPANSTGLLDAFVELDELEKLGVLSWNTFTTDLGVNFDLLEGPSVLRKVIFTKDLFETES